MVWQLCTAQCVPTCSRLCHPLLASCPWSGTTSALGVGVCWSPPSTGSAGEGCALSHTERQKQSRVCCSKVDLSRLFYPLLTGSAQQFLLSLVNAEAMQPLPCCRLSQLVDGTIPLHACLVEPGVSLKTTHFLACLK